MALYVVIVKFRVEADSEEDVLQELNLDLSRYDIETVACDINVEAL